MFTKIARCAGAQTSTMGFRLQEAPPKGGLSWQDRHSRAPFGPQRSEDHKRTNEPTVFFDRRRPMAPVLRGLHLYVIYVLLAQGVSPTNPLDLGPQIVLGCAQRT